MTDKKLKIEFAPGCFDQWDGTQEELDALMDELERQAETGEIFENSVPLTDDVIDDLSDEEQEAILAQLEAMVRGQKKARH
jgi:hypothetical protein